MLVKQTPALLRTEATEAGRWRPPPQSDPAEVEEEEAAEAGRWRPPPQYDPAEAEEEEAAEAWRRADDG